MYYNNGIVNYNTYSILNQGVFTELVVGL